MTNLGNKMTAIYEIVEAPVISLPFYPFADTYVSTIAPYSSINNGDKRSILIGNDNKGNHRALVKFDLSSIDSNLAIKDARLRLYYSSLIPDVDFKVHTIDGEWSEYGVTHLNRPSINNFITSDYVVNEIRGYIEFNVTDVVARWIKGIPNDGFYLTSDGNASTFSSRESSLSPILFVDYKDTTPYKITHSKSEFDIIVRAPTENVIEFDIEVGETYTTDDVEFEVFAHDPNHTYTDDIEFEITSVEIVPTQVSDIIEWEIVSALPQSSQIEWSLLVNEYGSDNDVEFMVVPLISNKSTVQFGITVREYSEKSDVRFDVDARKTYINKLSRVQFEVAVPEYFNNSDVEFELLARYVRDSIIEFETSVNQYEDDSIIEWMTEPRVIRYSNIEFNVDVPEYQLDSDSEFEIRVQGYGSSEIEWEIYVPYSEIEFDVTPLFSDENTIEFEVNPRVYYISDIQFELTVPIYLDDTEIEWDAFIRSVGHSDIEFEVAVGATKGYAYAFII